MVRWRSKRYSRRSQRGIDVAVANKELIVAAGELLVEAARRSGSRVLPVDSEHSAIFQCLVGEAPESVAAIVLTASGGPFRNASREEMERAGVAAALAHPTWRMGTKNTIDSATMMNKGLEVIEASRLFGIEGERMRIVVHPQSIAHGFVIFTDGSVKSQLAYPDMRLPIGYALSYPKRLESYSDGANERRARSRAALDLGRPERRGRPALRFRGARPRTLPLHHPGLRGARCGGDHAGGPLGRKRSRRECVRRR